VALILAVAVAGFVVAGMLAERDVQRDSERRAEVAAAQIHGRIAQAASLTESLCRFMLDASGTGVTSDQFARNAFRWLSPADFPAAAWVEPVPDSQRAAYERRIGQPVVTPDEGHRVVPAGSRSSYLAATLVSGFPPLALPGIDLSGEPDMATALDRATHLDRVTATPVAGPDTGTNGLFLVAPAPNLVGESLRPGYVVVFVPDMTLSAAANTPGLRLAVGGTDTGGPPGEQTVRASFTEAGQRFDAILPRGSVQGAATALPWIILACGLVLAGLAAALGINAARRARAQNELDRIFNLSPDLIAVANFERHFTRVNPAAEQILGYTRDELLERPYLDFVHPDDRERTAAEAAAISQGKTTLSFENRYVGKDGSYRVLEWTATPVVEENVMYAVARDVTERRRAEIELERLAREQAALRRVATLVAHGVRPDEIFAAVSDEVARLVGTDSATVMRYDDDGPGIVFVGVASNMSDAYPLGARWEFHDGMASAEVYRTGRSARGGARDWSTLKGPVGETHHRLGIVSTVASPIVVEGRLWGAIAVQSQDPLPMDTDERLEKFTELVGTAIANADSKSELAASRRRVITAADDARRRIERDLHDGTQQRLVSLSFALRMAQSTEPSNCSALQAEIGRVADELAGAIEELRELARGIHPAVLSKGGLGPALRGLARRAALPVELDIRTESRAADRIEVAAYYVVSEALTNTTKHARASCARVLVEHRDALLHLSIRDDGIGGADPAGGSGLIGLRDRAQALSGSIEVNSPPGGGTEIVVELPL
jgi:PAS domain S-box-containing protein